MGKHSNKEAYFRRLQELAQVNKKVSVNETKGRTLGTLIDFKTAADGYTYGIIKENHHYYIKKSNNSNNPDITDFAYIGGLGNITDYQYKKLSDADKNRNMILNTINEAYSTKMSKTSSKPQTNKKMLSENVDEDAEEEIAQAEDKLDDLEAVTAEPAPAPEMPDVGTEEFPETPTDSPEGAAAMDDIGAAPEAGEETPAAEPAPEAGEEMPDMGGEEAPAEEPAPEGGEEVPDLDGLGLDDEGGEEVPAEEPEGEEGEETPAEEPEGEEGEEDLSAQDQDSLVSREIEKAIGKLGHRIRKTDLTDEQTSSYLKQLISAFKGDLKDLEIEDRKEIADKILKIVPDEDIEDLDVSGEDEEGLPMAAETEEKDICAECGSFVQYAESRGYTSESILEATNEEMANLAGGYINAYKDGMNEGDYTSVATHLTQESFEMLKEEYGFDDEDLSEFQSALNECGDDEDRMKKMNELWGGLKSLAKGAGDSIAKGADSLGQAAKGAGKAVADKAKQAGQAVADKAKEAGKGIKQQYYKGEVNPHVDKMEKAAKDLQQALNSYNSVLQKAGQEPVQINDLLADIFGGIGTPSAPLTKAGKEMTPQQRAAWQAGKGGQPAGIDLSQYKNETEEVEEGLDDAGKIEVQDVQPTFAQESQTLGVAVNEAHRKAKKRKLSESEQTELSQEQIDYIGKLYDTFDYEDSVGRISMEISGYASKDPLFSNFTDKKLLYSLINNEVRSIRNKFKNDYFMGDGSERYQELNTPPDNQSQRYNDHGEYMGMWEGKSKKNTNLNESEQKVRKYVRMRLEEKMGLRKAKINESAKSESLKKLDSLIDKQFKLYETVVKKKVKIGEGRYNKWSDSEKAWAEIEGRGQSDVSKRLAKKAYKGQGGIYNTGGDSEDSHVPEYYYTYDSEEPVRNTQNLTQGEIDAINDKHRERIRKEVDDEFAAGMYESVVKRIKRRLNENFGEEQRIEKILQAGFTKWHAGHYDDIEVDVSIYEGAYDIYVYKTVGDERYIDRYSLDIGDANANDFNSLYKMMEQLTNDQLDTTYEGDYERDDEDYEDSYETGDQYPEEDGRDYYDTEYDNDLYENKKKSKKRKLNENFGEEKKNSFGLDVNTFLGTLKVMDRHSGEIIDRKGVQKIPKTGESEILRNIATQYTNKYPDTDYYVFLSVPRDIEYKIDMKTLDDIIPQYGISWEWSDAVLD